MKLSPHFALAELVPTGMPFDSIPEYVRENLTKVAVTLLEPVRQAMGHAIIVHSGWRPPLANYEAGGVRSSDHLSGSAADFHVVGSSERSWEIATYDAYHWVRANLVGKYGQLILEDHREALQRPGKLWVHVSLPGKHNGEQLVSFRPGSYEHYDPMNENRA